MWKSNAPKRPGKTPAPGLVQWRLMTTFILELIQIHRHPLERSLIERNEFFLNFFLNGVIDN